MRDSCPWSLRAALMAAALFITLLSSGSSQAQTFRGTVLGSVTDSSGAAVVGVTVTVHNVDTGVDRITDTTADGGYLMPELPVGTYDITAELKGFQKAKVTGVTVSVAAERRVDIVLKPGEITQQVEVSAETLPVVDTSSDTLGGTFESREVNNLPVNGRDYTRFLIMVPGTAGEPNGGGDSPGSFGLFSANGNRGRANNFLLDGTDMNDGYRNLPAINQGGVFGTPGTVLPLESIAEVNILSNFQPEYGRNAGSVVNIVTKSGTNDIHGSVFEYFRNAVLNARNYFNESDQPANAFRNNQFGGAIGGPIVKDKAFFYFAYEGQREGLDITSINAVPTLNDGVVNDPNDYAQVIQSIGGNPALCTTTVIACIDGNAAVVNPVIKNFYDLCDSTGKCSGGKNVWPTSNTPIPPTGGGNSAAPTSAFNNADSLIAKIDYNWSARNQITGRYFFGNSNQSFPLGLGGGNNLPNTNTNAPIRTQLVSLSWVGTLSPTKINEARFGWNRYRNGFFPADASVFGNPEATLQLNTGVTNPRDFGLPTMRFDELSFLGSSPFSNPRNRVDKNWQFIDGFSWKLNKHDIKMGYEFHRTAVDSFNDFSQRGVLVFPGLVNFIQGTPGTSVLFANRIITGDTDRSAAQNSDALYIQDSYRLTSTVTLNAGLRWDYFGVIHEAQGRLSAYDPVLGLVNRNPLYNKDLNNFSPRLSLAWDVLGKGKTVVRAGFGTFFDNFSQDAFTGQIYANSFNAGMAYNPIAPDPVFVDKHLANPTIAPGVPVFTPGNIDATTDASSVQKNLRTPYVSIYNLGVQQELFRNTVLQVSYVGSSGRKLLRLRDINQLTNAQIDQIDIACGIQDPIPRGTPVPGSCTALPFTTFPGFTTPLSPVDPKPPLVVNELQSSANSNYNSLQVSLTQRNWYHFYNQIAYTWSHSIDDASDSQDYVPNASTPQDSTNPRADRAPSNFDVRQRFVWSSVYEFPKWQALGRMGEGWSASGILTLMSGHPFSLNYNGIDDYSGAATDFDRPDVVGPIKYNRSNPSQFLDMSSFEVPCTFQAPNDGFADSCVPGTRHFGSLGRNALLGPDYRNFDLNITKLTTLTERFKLQFRVDFYNFTNHPNFANPLAVAFIADAAPNRSANFPTGFNQFTGISQGFWALNATSDVGLGNPVLGGGGQRSIQFAVKLLF